MKRIIPGRRFIKESAAEEPIREKTSFRSETTVVYKRHGNRKILFLSCAGLLLLILSMLTIRMGGTGLNYLQIFDLLFSPDGSWNSTVIWKLRLPRIAAALLAGSSLAVAGTVMQSILRNPLASPFTLGISNAAAFGAALAIVVFNGGRMVGSVQTFSMISDPVIVTLCAFFCAMIATAIIIGLVGLTECSSETIVLAGLAINAIFGTGLALLTFIADDVAIASIVFWQFGSLSKAEWSNIRIVAPILVLSFSFFYIKRWDYNSMEAGEEVARGLGVNLSSIRLVSLVISALLTATVVSFFGIIGFIGLIGPHMIKRLIGNDNRYTLIGSMLIGSTVLLLSHIVGSYAFKVAIPVGIITSAIGGPIFLMILLRGGRK